jgi:hypothetical protein
VRREIRHDAEFGEDAELHAVDDVRAEVAHAQEIDELLAPAAHGEVAVLEPEVVPEERLDARGIHA